MKYFHLCPGIGCLDWFDTRMNILFRAMAIEFYQPKNGQLLKRR